MRRGPRGTLPSPVGLGPSMCTRVEVNHSHVTVVSCKSRAEAILMVALKYGDLLVYY